MKRFTASVIAVFLILSFCACGSSDPNLGTYNGTTIFIIDNEEPMTELYEGDNYIVLKDAENAVITLNSETMEPTYVIDGTDITFTLNDLTASGTIENGVISIKDFFGISIVMNFEKQQ